MHPKHPHRVAEKTAENRFLQNQVPEDDEAEAHHRARDDHAPPPGAGAPPADRDAQDAE